MMYFQQSSGPSPIHGFGVRWAIVWRDPEASSPLNLAGATILGASQCASRRLPCGLSLNGLYPRWLSKLGCPLTGCPLAGCPPNGPRRKLRAGDFKAARPTCCGKGRRKQPPKRPFSATISTCTSTLFVYVFHPRALAVVVDRST